MIARYRRELSVAAAYLVLLLLLAVAAPRFYRADQLRAWIVSMAPVLVAAVGMTLVILCRQIDISIGSIFSICGVVAGLLAQTGLPIGLVALGTLLTGGFLGAINGVLVARLGLPSIVVTLATLVIWRESLRYARGRIRAQPAARISVVRAGPDNRPVGHRRDRNRGLCGLCLGIAQPDCAQVRLCDGLRSRSGAARGHPPAAGRLSGIRRDGNAGRAGRLARAQSGSPTSTQTQALAWSFKSSRPSW